MILEKDMKFLVSKNELEAAAADPVTLRLSMDSPDGRDPAYACRGYRGLCRTRSGGHRDGGQEVQNSHGDPRWLVS